MSKKNKSMNKAHIAILVIVIIIAVVAYQKYGGVETAVDENAAANQAASEASQAAAQEEAAPEKAAEPLYPEPCYAKGGVPVKTSVGCSEGKASIGDVSGFKVPYVCCA